MNRLFYLSQTLPLNILNSSSYPEKEFVLLDYNSTDGLYEWAKENLTYWVKSGVVRYLRTKKPKYYSAAHSKNIAHKNATGDILCNLDCDNFITKDFCSYLNCIFDEPNVMFGSSSQDIFGNNGCCGKIAVTKETFYSVNGYDEAEEINQGWGWDDVNFRYRAQSHNNLKLVYGEVRHNIVIDHCNSVRIANYSNKNIYDSRKISMNCLESISKEKKYIANRSINWGVVEDLKIGLY